MPVAVACNLPFTRPQVNVSVHVLEHVAVCPPLVTVAVLLKVLVSEPPLMQANPLGPPLKQGVCPGASKKVAFEYPLLGGQFSGETRFSTGNDEGEIHCFSSYRIRAVLMPSSCCCHSCRTRLMPRCSRMPFAFPSESLFVFAGIPTERRGRDIRVRVEIVVHALADVL